ncbi:Pectinesterase inhibitor domain [Arabidopsis suecica]|uniref:Pectinesterase inhibitor domain n=1 Tax=Arabidopsis suecica TaxID=45249 RepID=A0A8T2F3F7_ARASU|nr:Pectinesterase inhibitor domain [Arabidopsis suecica]
MESNKTFRIIVIFTISILVTISAPVESRSECPSPAPAPAPEVMKPISSPANSPAEIDINSPAASPEAPADSISPTNALVAEIDIDSLAASPEAPVASPEAPAESSSAAPSGIKVSSSPRSVLNPSLLSPEIKTICGKTDNPPLCESSVSPLLTPQLKPDTSSVLILAIQASLTATKAAMATVEKAGASDCQELYDDAVVNLEDAVNAVKSRDIATVNTNLSAAMTDYSTCNDGFEEAGEPNPLADVADKLTKMVSNCLAISTLIK